MVRKHYSFEPNHAFIAVVLCSASLFLVTDSVLIRGSGATFPQPVYDAWRPAFRATRQRFVSINMPYDGYGSGTGKKNIKEGPNVQVEYAGSDSVLSAEEHMDYPDLKMFPTMAGALVLAYNIPELGERTLRLTREQIVGMYNGTYRNWNDITFQEWNPAHLLPNSTIRVTARADKSGSTNMFTEALSLFSSEWRERPSNGTFSLGLNDQTGLPYHWDPHVVELYGQKTRGISGLIMSMKYSIGYLSSADARQIQMKYAMVQNQAGDFVEATTGAIQTAMDYYASRTDSLTTTLSDCPMANAYPIAGYTYFIVYLSRMPQCDRAKELFRYIEWFTTDINAHQECTNLNMVPLSSAVVKRITEEVLEEMKCDQNLASVRGLVLSQKNDEYWESQTWRTPVAATSSILLVIITGVIAYFIYLKMKLLKMIDNDEWDIPIEDITFHFDEKTISGGKSKLAAFRSVKSLKSLDEIPEGLELLNTILQWPGKWKVNQIGLRLLEVSSLKEVDREMKRTMIWMRDSVVHQNVLRFFGLSALDADRYVISEYSGKGPMTDILQNDKYNLNSDFKLSLSSDIANGLAFLHAQGIIHGNLRSSCCLIDSRWNVKIADWEYYKLFSSRKSTENPMRLLRNNREDVGKHIAAFREFWTAPEILTSDFEKFPSTDSDVFSFSIILQEIFTREDPYAEHADFMSPEEVVNAILTNNLRPEYTMDTPVGVRQIMEIGWMDEPTQRPSMDQVIKMLRHTNPTRKSMLDTMMGAMEEYTAHLEERIEERTSEVMLAKQNMEALLGGLIPYHIASKIANGHAVKSEIYDSMSILTIEILDFPDLSILQSPNQAVSYLNEVSSELETVIKKYEIFRATIEGDNYILVSGFREKASNEGLASTQIAHLALDIVNLTSRLPQPSFHDKTMKLRYGAHTGRLTGALIGSESPRFCILGGSIKTALLLRKTSLPGKIHISADFQSVISKHGFHTEHRFDEDNASEDNTFWLTGRDGIHVDLLSDKSTDSSINGFLTEKNGTGNEILEADDICNNFTGNIGCPKMSEIISSGNTEGEEANKSSRGINDTNESNPQITVMSPNIERRLTTSTHTENGLCQTSIRRGILDDFVKESHSITIDRGPRRSGRDCANRNRRVSIGHTDMDQTSVSPVDDEVPPFQNGLLNSLSLPQCNKVTPIINILSHSEL